MVEAFGCIISARLFCLLLLPHADLPAPRAFRRAAPLPSSDWMATT
jgi:hypothetical protein